MLQIQVPIPESQLRDLCDRWQVREMSLFGSVLREDFHPGSDIDILVSFREDARLGLWDLVQMQQELESLFSRRVDLVELEALRNPYRSAAILSSREIVYADH